ncbi:MAG: hypothetical protein A3F83_04375 [Candidatus Glassbacteria bacterium RIFCSPLOWO2_12_FULL_58_11]|uniref:Acetyl xylan esterase domain-containing protein n=1 Tax=Candidatus Glassbacteria bacterium RIFCSPLOWO2_12_FULL_58_11 TaxID=1817867 RepID=A0A1F5YS00_9BACT|nr:MAG: hypothetical protein A3F83_04375 [Candidatus Glassbacteria bacterium RIFCSPLOWO2_12_FULL_58_11]
MNKLRCLLPVLLLAALPAARPVRAWNEYYTELQQYFEQSTIARHDSLFKGIGSVAQWEKERARIKGNLLKMLGLDRTWPAEPPAAQVTNRIERPDYVLECLVLETAPQIYSTANFYIPKGQGSFPLVIYQCGHSPRGIYGNKEAFKHHGAWFASRGIAVLILDSIELGELKVTHHGLYSNYWYDLLSRGYSPLAAELYNARRAIDYLVTRPEVDPERIGATGISGGGVTTFFLAQIDDRIKAAAPVSGECSSVGQVQGRLAVEHCDCMYPVNSYGLLFSEMGALVAPRPFLLCNALADGLFPMPYFKQMVDKMSVIYSLYGAGDKLRTATVPGGHADSEAIRLPVYAFFLKEFLGREEAVTGQGPVDTLKAGDLLCYRSGFPLDERLTRIQHDFMPEAVCNPQPLDPVDRRARRSELAAALKERVFPGMAEPVAAPSAQGGREWTLWQRRLKEVSLSSFGEMKIKGIFSVPEKSETGERLPAVLMIKDAGLGNVWWMDIDRQESYDWGGRAALVIELLDDCTRAIDDSLRHQMKREAMIIGRSFDEMRLQEIRLALAFLRAQPEVDPDKITLVGRSAIGVNALYAGLFDERVERVVLESPSGSHTEGPYYLGVLTVTDIPEVAWLMSDRLRIFGDVPVGVAEALRQGAPSEKVICKNLADGLR